MSERAWLYIIAEEHGDDLKPPVKIGISGNPWSRVNALQAGCPSGYLYLYHAFCLANRELARSLEQHFHRWQDAKRIHGEWFELSPDEALSLLRTHVIASLWDGEDEAAHDQFMDVVYDSPARGGTTDVCAWCQ